MKTHKKIGILMIALLTVIFAAQISIAQSAPEIPDKLKLRAAKENLLGKVMIKGGNGRPDWVKYAYRSNRRVSNKPGAQVTEATRKAGTANPREDLSKRTKHARTFKTNNPKVYITEVIPGDPQYYKDPHGKWWVADYATTTVEAYHLQAKGTPLERLVDFFAGHSAFAIDTTFYPDADPESTSIDGTVAADNGTNHATHAQLVAGIGYTLTSRDTGDDPDYAGYFFSTGNTADSIFDVVRRWIWVFDTSSINDADSIDSATLNLYHTSLSDTQDFGSADNSAIVIAAAAPTSATSLLGDDYLSVGLVLFGETVKANSLTTSAYTTVILNANGLANISKTATSAFSGRTKWDFLDTTSGMPSSVSGAGFLINFSSADHIGTSQDPKLVVTHTGPRDCHKRHRNLKDFPCRRK